MSRHIIKQIAAVRTS